METPIAHLKDLHMAFLENNCDFSKVPEILKRPMLVKVFRTYPYLFLSDKENYIAGYLPVKDLKKYSSPKYDLKGKTLKITKFRMEMCHLEEHENKHVSYMNREIKLIIEEFSISRPLEKHETNRFVINISRDEEFKLHMAIFMHKEKCSQGKATSLEKFLREKAKITFGSLSDTFQSTYMGPITPEEGSLPSKSNIQSRLKIPELVTCVIEDDTDEKKQKKRAKKDNIKEEIKELHEHEYQQSKSENPKEIFKSEPKVTPKRSRKTRKPLRDVTNTKALKKEIIKEEEKETTPTYDDEVRKILSYFKKSKSNPDMDFLNEKDKKPSPKKRTPKKVNKTMNLSKFKEYINWYDQRSLSAAKSSARKSTSTGMSTPFKSKLKLREKIYQASKIK